MKRRFMEAFAIFLLGFACWFVADLWTCANCLEVNEFYYVSQKAEEDITLVVIADLHDQEFGQGNHRLIETIRSQNPDVIFMLGDMMNRDTQNPRMVYDLIQDLTDVAPVYFAPGNHEWDYMELTDSDVMQKLEEAGAVVLEKEYVDVRVKGTDIRIGGFYGYAFCQNPYQQQLWYETQVFLRDFVDTDHVKIMLSHRPDSFIFGDAAYRWDVDLLLSGHLHGGQIVLPYFGGVSGGDQGWFPEYVHGMYEIGVMDMFITGGLGSSPESVPRINNVPEVAVIHVGAE